MSQSARSVLIINDHISAREGLCALIALRPDWRVCSTAACCIEALQETRQHLPDIIILDLGLPDCEGPELIRELLILSPNSSILAISVSPDPVAANAALDFGAKVFLHEDSLRHTLHKAIDAIFSGIH